MTVSVISPQVADLVPIEHESVDRLVRTLVFALPPASLAVVAFDRHSEFCRLDGLEFFASIKRALARPRAGVTERVRLRWRGAPEGTPSGLSRSPSASRS